MKLVQRFRGLGSSVTSLLHAEVHALGEELGETGYAFGRVAIRIAILATFVFWSVAVLLYAAVAGLSLWLPAWAGALIVAVILMVVTWILYLGVRRQVSELEMPIAIVRRRVDDHLEFWHSLGAEASSDRSGSTTDRDRGRRGAERSATEENW